MSGYVYAVVLLSGTPALSRSASPWVKLVCECAVSWIRVFLSEDMKRPRPRVVGTSPDQLFTHLCVCVRARACVCACVCAGTRPDELYTQLAAVSPKMFSDWNYFAKRYCDAKKTRFGLDTKVAPLALAVGCDSRQRGVSMSRQRDRESTRERQQKREREGGSNGGKGRGSGRGCRAVGEGEQLGSATACTCSCWQIRHTHTRVS